MFNTPILKLKFLNISSLDKCVEVSGMFTLPPIVNLAVPHNWCQSFGATNLFWKPMIQLISPPYCLQSLCEPQIYHLPWAELGELYYNKLGILEDWSILVYPQSSCEVSLSWTTWLILKRTQHQFQESDRSVDELREWSQAFSDHR